MKLRSLGVSLLLCGSGLIALNTDDRNVVEFAFARSLGQDTVFDLDKARARARERQQDTPVLSQGSVDWDLVKRLRVSTITAEGVTAPQRPDLTGEELRQNLVQKSFLEGRPDAVFSRWRVERWEPIGFVALAVVSQALADEGDESASTYIDHLRETRPTEAGILLAQLRWRQGRLAEATGLLEGAFSQYREVPWPLVTIMYTSFSMVETTVWRPDWRGPSRGPSRSRS